MKITPIGPKFGAEITDIRLDRDLSDEEVAALDRAFATWAVVVFPGQTLDNESQMAFASRFGPLEGAANRIRSDNKHRIGIAAIADVSNLDENNKPRAMGDRQRLQSLGNRLWHSDASFRPVVGALSMLYAHAVPPSGGETEFADTRTGWETLPADLRAQVRDLKAVHLYGTSRTKLGFPSFSEEEAKALPPVLHPVVRRHVGSGRDALYVGSHVTHIDGMPVPEGRMLVWDLLEHTTQRELVYSHRWSVGDLVVWDNRATLHRGRRFDESYPRDLRRVTTKDDGVAGEVVAEARSA